MKALTSKAAVAAPLSLSAVRPGLLQRKCACGGAAGMKGNCEECESKKLTLRRSTSAHGAQSAQSPAQGSQATAPPIVNEVLGSSGRALDAPLRREMESHFGHDFSRVRVHTDARASESARSVGARAYTVGSDIVFGAGQYTPATEGGRRLLAHELAHTVQQAGPVRLSGEELRVGVASDASEREADEAAEAVMRRRPFGVNTTSAPRVARQPLPVPSPVPGPSPTPAQESREEKEKRLGNLGMSKVDEGRQKSTWGWGAPETNNVFQVCQIAALERPAFLNFMNALPSASQQPQGRRSRGLPAVTLGITEAYADKAEPPKIAFTQVPDGQKTAVKLKPTRAAMPPIRSAHTKAGTFVEGEVASGVEGCAAERIRLKAQRGSAKFPITWKVSEDGAQRIREGEQEHCNDITHAFNITLGVYASSINNEAAADRDYGSEQQGFKDVVSRIGVHPDQMLPNFISRAARTTQRDANNWHTPSTRAHQAPSPENDCQAAENINAAALPDIGKPSIEVME